MRYSHMSQLNFPYALGRRLRRSCLSRSAQLRDGRGYSSVALLYSIERNHKAANRIVKWQKM